MSDVAPLTDDEITALRGILQRGTGYVPGEIPTDDVRPPASAWPAGDVHHTQDQVAAESPAGVAGATVDPRDAEILRLTAALAESKAATPDVPAAVAVDQAPVVAVAQTVDPRDDEIERLKADLALATGDQAPEPGVTETAGDAAAEATLETADVAETTEATPAG